MDVRDFNDADFDDPIKLLEAIKSKNSCKKKQARVKDEDHCYGDNYLTIKEVVTN